MDRSIVCVLWLLCVTTVSGGEADWAEGSPAYQDGATRDYYNRGAVLSWQHFMGDWRDAEDESQGNRSYARVQVADTDSVKKVRFDVTQVVRQWQGGRFPNQGFFLRVVDGRGKIDFASREHATVEHRPVLQLTTGGRMVRLLPVADTHLTPSTYRSLGTAEELRVSGEPEHALLRFDHAQIRNLGPIESAALELTSTAQYGPAEIGIFRCRQGHDDPSTDVRTGIAARYSLDRGIDADPDVVFAAGFDSKDWQSRWTVAEPKKRIDVVESASRFEGFRPINGSALRSRIAEGEFTALNTLYKFRAETGAEPTEIYFRYYLRLADDWNQTVQGGKLPGISGTYGRGGWGGRKSDGVNGWSARGLFKKTVPDGNPLAGRTPVGFYCYHADMKDRYGTNWIWDRNYLGYLETNRWYSIEQFCRLNTPGEKDGVLRAWVDGQLAFEKTDVRFRLTPELRIEQVWMNLYHGGTTPSPYDQHVFIDNVVIARKYIGPMGD